MSWGWKRVPPLPDRLAEDGLREGGPSGLFMVSPDGLTPRLARMNMKGEIVPINTDLPIGNDVTGLVWCPIDWPEDYENTPA